MSFNLFPTLLGEMHAPVLAGSMGAAFTVIIERCASKYRWHGVSLSHHTHTGLIPRVGGIAVFLAVTAGYIIDLLLSPQVSGKEALTILGCAIPVLLVGAYDDIRHTSPKVKLMAQVLAGVLFAGAVFGFPLLLDPEIFLAGGALVFWLVLTTNSFNLIDGIDGLAAGTASIMGLSLAFVNLALGNRSLAALSLVVAAACVGFLPWNVLGRRIFLGDSGSLAIGFVLAAIAALTAREANSVSAAVVLFGFPISETLLTVVRRKLKGRSIFKPDREHLHHKLRNARFSLIATLCTLFLVSAAFNCLGVMLFLGSPIWSGVGTAALLFVLLAYAFGYFSDRTQRRLRGRLGSRPKYKSDEVPGYVSYTSEYSLAPGTGTAKEQVLPLSR